MNVTRWKRYWPILPIALVIGMLAAFIPPALASTKSAPVTVDGVQLPAGTVVSPMGMATVVSVVKKGAKTSTVRLSTGATTTIPTAGVALALQVGQAVEPDDVATGACGVSYIYLGLKSNGYPLTSQTGFIITLGNVAAFTWQASYSGPNGFAFQGQTTGGAVPVGTEKNLVYDSPTNGGSGSYRGAVSASSKAVLTDGVICYSLGPTEDDTF